MAVEFPSHLSYRDFAESVSRRWRFFHNTQTAFFDALRDSLASRIEQIPVAFPLWRAQIGNAWREELAGGEVVDVPTSLEFARMKPLKARATEGRVNPKGMPCLYAATHRETAIAEVRPWIGAYVSVAGFKLSRELRTVNCTNDGGGFKVYFEPPDAEEKERAVWRDINRAFRRPVTPADDVASYVPTQVLAEFFRSEGLDGIGYGSSVGPGHNVALFDLDAAHIVNCQLMEVKSISVSFDEADYPQFP